MAAKLKKRALAEYESQILTESGETTKRLKLSLRHSNSVDSEAEVGLDLDTNKPEESILADLIQYSGQIYLASTDSLLSALKKLEECLSKVRDSFVRQKLVVVWGLIVASGRISNVEEKLKKLEEFVIQETSNKVISAWTQAALQVANKVDIDGEQRDRLFKIGQKILCSTANPQVHCSCLSFIAGLVKPDSAEINNVASQLCTSYSMSQDARVRTAAFKGLITIHSLGVKLDMEMYPTLCLALSDDYEGVRCEALKLIAQLATANPEHQVSLGGDRGSIRLVDDAFSRVCQTINDVRECVRCLAAKIIGTMTGVTPIFLQQTLDKKLMSNMRVKNNAHDRQAGLVSSGEWSSGKRWADDAPKQQLDEKSVNLVSLGSCGAFVHGLEDECMSVRVASINSLTTLATNNHSLAVLALDFLVDMFNDEIEQVRLKAIESLMEISEHIELQVHQLDIILGALDDYSTLLREKLHAMLQVCTIATKDGLKSVIAKLIANLKKYPQDRRSILRTFKFLGSNHPVLTLPLVSSLLDIHPFFDTPEPDIEDPTYLCTLVLVLNAAQHCPTLSPLLDTHTKRHHSYLQFTYPHLIPATNNNQTHCMKRTFNSSKQLQDDSECSCSRCKSSQSAEEQTSSFLVSVLKRVELANKMSSNSQTSVLSTACAELERLANIDANVSQPASFARMYIEAQIMYEKVVRNKAWAQTNCPSQVLRSHVESLVMLSQKLSAMFDHLGVENQFLIRLLKLKCLAVNLVYIVYSSNQSALPKADEFLTEFDQICGERMEFARNPFLTSCRNLNLGNAKPGLIASRLKPLLIAFPPDCLKAVSLETTQARATIYEPTGGCETPVRYAAGLVFGIPMDAEIANVPDISRLRICILTGDQVKHVSVPKRGDLVATGSAYRLLTTATFSHQVWSAALDVELSLVLELDNKKKEDLVPLCPPVRVSILPNQVRRGI